MILGDISPWLTLILFAFSFVCLLTATVLILNLAGRELGIRELLPEDERTVDDRDSSISRLLAITLLPFLGMYAAFGQVQEAANRVVVQQIVRYGVFGDVPTVLGALNDLAVEPAAAAGHPAGQPLRRPPAARPAARPHRLAAGRARRGAGRVVLHPAAGDGRHPGGPDLPALAAAARVPAVAEHHRRRDRRRLRVPGHRPAGRARSGSAPSSASRSGRSSSRC